MNFFIFGNWFKYSLFIIVNMIYFFINENINYLSIFFFVFCMTVGVGRHLLLSVIQNCLDFVEIRRQVWMSL